MHARVDPGVGNQRRAELQRYGGGQDVGDPEANAKAEAEWPEGKEVEPGIGTWRATGTA